jgi:predicted amidohydrolase
MRLAHGVWALAALGALAVVVGYLARAQNAAPAGQSDKESTMAKKKADEVGEAAAQPAAAAPAQRAGKPRKVIVGTTMYAMWGEYPGLQKRLDQLGGLIDDMAQQAKAKYGRSIDVAALPEVAVNGGRGYGPAGALPLKGAVQDYFAAKAREHNCYIVVPLYTSEEQDGKTVCYNACALIGRKGELVGIYHKVHAVSGYDNDLLEGGALPGKNFPVFQCDFGTLGIQICFDICYDDGWEALARQGAELVVWSTQSPGQIRPARRAQEHHYFVLTSTWRNNASLFDPLGANIRCITKPEERVFAEEIDLEYVLLPWQPKLQNGKAFDEKFPGKAGYRYSEAEDEGIFWSNDPAKPILEMVRELGLMQSAAKVEKDRLIQDRLRGGPPEMPNTNWRQYWQQKMKERPGRSE